MFQTLEMDALEQKDPLMISSKQEMSSHLELHVLR